jgi:hypothetical protein
VDSVTPDEPRRAPIRWHVATVRDARTESPTARTLVLDGVSLVSQGNRKWPFDLASRDNRMTLAGAPRLMRARANEGALAPRQPVDDQLVAVLEEP